MEFRKNDIVTLEIVDCGTDGEGIGKADGFTVFVKDAVIGDIVTAKIMKAKKNYGYGRLMEILKPSPYRVESVCPSARQCGGCQLQAVSYEEQKVFKETVYFFDFIFWVDGNRRSLCKLAFGFIGRGKDDKRSVGCFI